MAKKTTKQLPENVSATAKKGWRQCPSCELYSKGTRGTNCLNPDCGKPFPQKAQRSPKNANSIAGTLQILTDVKAYVEASGGSEKAKEAIAEIEALSKKVGSIEDLKKAIDTLEQW